MGPRNRLQQAADDLANASEDVSQSAYEGHGEAGVVEMKEALGKVKEAVKEIEEIIR